MVKRSILMALGLMALAGCGVSRTSLLAYTTPGWYLERPRFLLITGPEIFAGPFTYDQCEAERMKSESSERLICVMEKARPGQYAPG